MGDLGPKRVAVIGGGISGLSAGFLLSNFSGHHVTLFEKLPSPGIDGHVARWTTETGAQIRVDVPFRVFNSSYYPNLTRLIDRLGLDHESHDISGTYHRTTSRKPFFTYKNVNVFGVALPFPRIHSFSDMVNIMIDYFRFYTFATRDLENGRLAGKSIGEYLKEKGYSEVFAQDVLLAGMSVVSTCSMETIAQFPADIVIYFLCVKSGTGYSRVTGGNQMLAKMLSQNTNVVCSAQVKHVYPTSAAAVARGERAVTVEHEDGRTEHFDEVIIATQANHALKLLRDASPDEKNALGLIEYHPSDVVVHRDPRFMPSHKSEWSVNNFSYDTASSWASATVWLNPVMPELGSDHGDVFQTWNPQFPIETSDVIGTSHFERPVMTPSTLLGIAQLSHLHRDKARHIWFCGSYARYAIPLLESGVISAMEIAEHLGAKLPWQPVEEKPRVWFRLKFVVSSLVWTGIVCTIGAKLRTQIAL